MPFDCKMEGKKGNYDTFAISRPIVGPEQEDILEKLESGTLDCGTTETESLLSDCVPENIGASPSMLSIRIETGQKKAQSERVEGVFFPWSKSYRVWWAFTVVAAVFTAFFETYQTAFAPAGVEFPFTDKNSIFEYILTLIFGLDILVSFNLAFYNERDEIIFDKKAIAHKYLRTKFWIDVVAVLPLQFLALIITGELGHGETKLAQYLALLRLLRLLRLYRIVDFLEQLQYDTRVSLLWGQLIKKFAATLMWTHVASCVLYFISKQYDFDEDETWIGGKVDEMTDFERYITVLYFSIVTFATVGYGDFAPVNPAEKIWGIVFMLTSMVIQAWIIGAITLLLIKQDEKTGDYRNTLETLNQYSTLHSFDEDFRKRLKTQLQLDFNTREIADESVLKNFPASIRRNVLRRLYMSSLVKTELMKDVREQFVDAFLTACTVEIFSPGEEILRRNSISSDLYLLIGGVVELVPSNEVSPYSSTNNEKNRIKAGDFINEVGFFCEYPQIYTVRTITICKTLTMSLAAYKMLAQDHPGSSGKILQNLLKKVQTKDSESGWPTLVNFPQNVALLRAGSVFGQAHENDDNQMTKPRTIPENSTLTAVQELVEMHIEKQKDDHTTRFLFAASRGDVHTVSVMCDQGFDPDSSDYDSRTALMVSSMKGNTEVVRKLLEYSANPNLVDMHGSSALYEAARNGMEDTMELLLQHGAKLCMSDSLAASILDQAVFDGDTQLLRRLGQANIQVNAADYDSRAPVHIAAAEGNVSALKTMVEFGADLNARDRWGNTVVDEAKRAGAGHLLSYLDRLRKDDNPPTT